MVAGADTQITDFAWWDTASPSALIFETGYDVETEMNDATASLDMQWAASIDTAGLNFSRNNVGRTYASGTCRYEQDSPRLKILLPAILPDRVTTRLVEFTSMRLLKPDIYVHRVTDVPAEYLLERGINGL